MKILAITVVLQKPAELSQLLPPPPRGIKMKRHILQLVYNPGHDKTKIEDIF